MRNFEVVSDMISKTSSDIGTLILETDLLYKFVSDIAENKINNLDEIVRIANCIQNVGI